MAAASWIQDPDPLAAYRRQHQMPAWMPYAATSAALLAFGGYFALTAKLFTEVPPLGGFYFGDFSCCYCTNSRLY